MCDCLLRCLGLNKAHCLLIENRLCCRTSVSLIFMIQLTSTPHNQYKNNNQDYRPSRKSIVVSQFRRVLCRSNRHCKSNVTS